MPGRLTEAVGLVTVLVGIGAATFGPFAAERHFVRQDLPANARVLTLTGVASSGVWTEAEVNGGNYWRRAFKASRPMLRLGEMVALRLKSADVIHTFYCPELGIGPVEVYPGKVATVVVSPKKTGVFSYYCTSFCGDGHFGMRGEIVVTADGGTDVPPPGPGIGRYWETPLPPAGASIVDRGRAIFRRRGCITCHGEDGRGGVPNFNYERGTVPALNVMADRMMLFTPEDVRAVVDELGRGVPLESLRTTSNIPRFSVVLAQYRSVRDLIRNGAVSAKKDPEGPDPPLQMPAWGGRLSDRDIDAVISYLLTLRPGG